MPTNKCDRDLPFGWALGSKSGVELLCACTASAHAPIRSSRRSARRVRTEGRRACRCSRLDPAIPPDANASAVRLSESLAAASESDALRVSVEHALIKLDRAVEVSLTLLELAMGLAAGTMRDATFGARERRRGEARHRGRTLDSSNLKVYRYSAIKSGATDGPPLVLLNPHADCTLVTIAPLSASRGLQVLAAMPDPSTPRAQWRWTDIEPAPERGEVMLFAGELLSWLTQGDVRPLMHRVIAGVTDGASEGGGMRCASTLSVCDRAASSAQSSRPTRTLRSDSCHARAARDWRASPR